MKLNLLSHNVRGLNDPLAVKRFELYLHGLNPRADIIMIQEHKTRGERLEILKFNLNKKYQCWATDASPGYSTQNNVSGGGKGGVGIFIPKALAHLVVESGSLSNRLLWIRLKGLPGGDVCIGNIYASNIPRERSELLERMVQDLPTNCRWIFFGDWNMVERYKDKSREGSSLLSHNERLLWSQFKSHFQIEDPFEYSGALKYTWDSGNSEGHRSLARLDRAYLTKHVGSSTHIKVLN